MPSGEMLFLKPVFLREACEYVGLPENLTDLTLSMAAKIARNPALRALAWHGHCQLYQRKERLPDWPVLRETLGENAGMFYVVVALSGFEQARAIHRERDIPIGIVRHTMYDVERSILVFRRIHGEYGITPTYAGGWLQNHFRGEIYRLGRLQYVPRTANDYNVAYRCRSDGSVIVLARDGQEYRRDGHCQHGGRDDCGAR